MRGHNFVEDEYGFLLCGQVSEILEEFLCANNTSARDLHRFTRIAANESAGSCDTAASVAAMSLYGAITKFCV